MTNLVAGVAIEDWPAWLRAFAALWLFVLGSCFGSFLNVVAYRWPRRLSLSRPGSHCPHCGKPIATFDNVPILAWLWLRGRCRKCGEPIAGRYALVELLAAVACLAVGWSELLAPRGAWLLAATHAHEGRAALVMAGHLVLVLTLLTATLLSIESAAMARASAASGSSGASRAAPFKATLAAQLTAWRGTLFLPAAVLAGGLLAGGLPLAPRLDVAAATSGIVSASAQRPPIDLKPGLFGLGVALTAATIWRMTRRTGEAPAAARYTVGSWLLIGVYLGPVVAAGVALIASIGELATALAIRAGLPIDRLPTTGWLTIAVVVVLVGWQRLIEAAARENLAGDWLAIAGALAAAAVAMALSGQLARVDHAR
jgi:leader peptidase (prepilin peptidase)/N-methyltransferase